MRGASSRVLRPSTHSHLSRNKGDPTSWLQLQQSVTSLEQLGAFDFFFFFSIWQPSFSSRKDVRCDCSSISVEVAQTQQDGWLCICLNCDSPLKELCVGPEGVLEIWAYFFFSFIFLQRESLNQVQSRAVDVSHRTVSVSKTFRSFCVKYERSLSIMTISIESLKSNFQKGSCFTVCCCIVRIFF